jgi:hypothetical protein
MAQTSRAASESQTSSKHRLKSTHSLEEHPPNRTVLFINHYSIDGAGKSHGPDRRTIGTHVQRIIRVQKRVDAEVKLRSRISDGSLLEFRFKDAAEDEVATSALQPFILVPNDLPSRPGHFSNKGLSQEACKLDEIELDPFDRVTPEGEHEEASLMLETIQLRLFELHEPSLFAGPFDSVLQERFPDRKPAKIAIHFCE